MPNILDKIVQHKRLELEGARSAMPLAALEQRLGEAPAVRDFRAALEATEGVAIIAEVKKASPSAGVLRADFDPVAIARIYAAHGASAISVLTDVEFFRGSLHDLQAIRQAVAVPLLRKDFILERRQLVEARLAGADAVLLIAEILGPREIPELLRQARDLGMEALVELYDADNLERVVQAGARLIGVNNRNLRTFEVRLEHTLELARRMPGDCCLVSESGIRSRGDILRLQAGGVRAVLIGETFMRSPDIAAKLEELRGGP